MNNGMDGRLMTAMGACAIAAVLFASTLAGALTSNGGDAAPIVPKAKTDAVQSAAAEVISMKAVNEAVAVDPFSEDRTPPATPYRLPTDPAEPGPPAPPPALPPIPAFALVGTTQTPTGSIALIQVGENDPKVLSVGESMNGYVVQRIDRTSATMVQGERSVSLQLQQPTMRAADVNPGARRGLPGRVNGPGGRANGQGRAGQNVDAAVQQKLMMQEMQQVLQNRMPTTIDVPVRVRRDTTSERSPRFDR